MALNEPALQLRQAVELAVAEKVPTMQVVQSVEPAPEKVPTGHDTHLDESFLKPALHTSGEQELWPTAVYAPSTAGHLVHADDPAESAKVPEAQAAQEVAPVASANLPAAHAVH